MNVGIPMNCIFPLRNYHNEINFSVDVDALMLSLLKSLINFGDDFINRKLKVPSSDKYQCSKQMLSSTTSTCNVIV